MLALSQWRVTRDSDQPGPDGKAQQGREGTRFDGLSDLAGTGKDRDCLVSCID